jgi:CPA1 family monovalent cation:H+ antiporter
MHEDITFSIVVVVIELLFIATVVAVASKRFRFPFTIGLVILGLFIGWSSKSIPILRPLSALQLTPDVVLHVFLPVLLFQAAFTLDARSLLKNISAIYMLAVPALLISTIAAGFMLHYLIGLPLWVALLFGALISATDPVAVTSLFKEMGAPKRLHLLVEGESLFNDGTALVVFKIILGIVLAGTFTGSDIAQGVLDFFIVSIGGTIVGIAIGMLFSWIIEKIWNIPLVEIALTTILAHSSFIIAEHLLHVSGVIATVIAGLTLGSYGKSKISPQVLGNMEFFWEYFAFVCNSLIFLLVGLSIDLVLFADNIMAIVLGTLTVLAARAIAVYTVFPTVGWFKLTERVNMAFQTVIFWGGLRGALAIVMALSIPESLPARPFILTLTFGIVLTNLLINGLTIKPLMSLFGLDRYSQKEHLERSQAILEARKRTMEQVVPFSAREGIDAEIAIGKKKDYKLSIEATEAELESLRESIGQEDASEMVLMHCMLLEKSYYHGLFKEGMLNEDNLKELVIDLDRRMDRLKEAMEVFVEEPLSIFEQASDALEKVSVFGALFRRERAGVKEDRYERERVRLSMTTLVLKEINTLKKRTIIPELASRKAEAIYNAMRERALMRMETIWKSSPEYVERVEQKLLERFCLTLELDSYQELYCKGSITEKILAEMEEQINMKLRSI